MSGLLNTLVVLLVCCQIATSQRLTPFSHNDAKFVFESNLNALKKGTFQQAAFNRAQGAFQRTQVPSRFRSQAASQAAPDDIIGQARIQVESLKRDLRSLTSKPEAAPILRKVFAGQNGGCFNNMEEAFRAIETSIKLFENAGTEIKDLVKIVDGFKNLSNTSAAVRESAKIIRLLDVLIPKLSPENTVCRTTNGEVITSLHSLSLLVEELSSKEDLFFSIQKRQTLNSAAIIVHRVTDFLEHVKKSFSKFDHVCSKDKDTNKGVLNMIGELMNDLTLLYTAVGGETAAAEIRQQGDIATSLVANINRLEDAELFTLDCNAPGSTQLVAESLDDLAELIDEVGIKTLCSQLDLDCSALP